MAKDKDANDVKNELNANAPIDPVPATPTKDGGDYVGGRLTRPAMERIIKGGGSVLYKGKSIMKAEELPDDAELASTDAEVATALDSIDAQIAALQARKSTLNSLKTK